MSSRSVHATVDGLACSATAVEDRETFEDPGGFWLEDIAVTDEDDGVALDFEELEEDTQEKVREALVEAARDS